MAKNLSDFYRSVGNKGWRKSAYFTDTWKFPKLRSWIVARLPKRTRRILSIGCGTGELERALGRMGFEIAGLDFSFEMLRSAARRSSGNFVQGDAHHLPFAADSFDAVILPESLGHLNARLAFQEAQRVLKKRGRLLITTYPQHRATHALYAASSMAGLCADLIQTGFRIREQKLLLPKRAAIEEVAHENRSELLYVLATKSATSPREMPTSDAA